MRSVAQTITYLFVCFWIVFPAPTWCSDLDDQINEFLIRVSSSINKKCPMQVDRFIVLKNTVVDGKTLIYRYQTDFQGLLDYSTTTYGRSFTISDLRQGFIVAAVKEDCSDPDDPFFKVGASIGRYYYDSANNLRIKVITTKEDCPR